MKKLLALGIGISCLALGGMAFADAQRGVTSKRAFRATLTQLNIDKKMVNLNGVNSGTIEYDLGSREASLVLYRIYRCPDGQLCPQFMPAPQIVRLPIVSVQTDSCGIRTIQAEKDQRRGDGALHALEIRDFTKNRCDYLPVSAGSAVTYTVQSVRPAIDAVSTFEGEAFERLN